MTPLEKKLFKEKVLTMTAKEIIMAMVESLKNPVTRIDMGTYGALYKPYNFKTDTYSKKSYCYGCAATNTICHIADIKLTAKNIVSCSLRAKALKVDEEFLDWFESAIDALRRSDIDDYNGYAEKISIAQITEPFGFYLPELDDNYTTEELDHYIELANLQLI